MCLPDFNDWGLPKPDGLKGGTRSPCPFTPRWPRDAFSISQAVYQQLTFSETPPSVMDSHEEVEQDFPVAELEDPVWLEQPIPNRQWLCIHQIQHWSITGHTPVPTTPAPQPVQEEVLPEGEEMNISILDDLPDDINVPKELYSDLDSWAQSVLGHLWWNDLWIWPVNTPWVKIINVH